MFTGLIETLGSVADVTPGEGASRLRFTCRLAGEPLAAGESIAVDGVCLTAASVVADGFEADVIAETLRCTTLGGLAPGAPVNLERALRLADRLGGHLVQGHVDTTTEVLEVRRQGGDYRLRLGSPPDFRRFLAYKGSVALQGVSLTVAAADREGFEVALIPETLARTNLGNLAAGSRVNLEVDLLARYLESLQRDGAAGPGMEPS